MQYQISDDKSRLNIETIHRYLTRSYWAEHIPIAIIEKAIAGSLCFGVYDQNNQQIGFARVITDCATFGYLADVFILEPYRGKGLSKKLMAYIMKHPDLQCLRRFVLATSDAHNLYKQFGFTALTAPDTLMEIRDTDIYKKLLKENKPNG